VRARADVVAIADDRRPIPPPESKQSATTWDSASGWFRGFGEQLHPAFTPRSGGVDHVGDVPDSTWFTNRNAVRPLSPAAITEGPGLHSKPRDDGRWSVIGTKSTGFAIGIRVRDENGDEFVLKFDQLGHDEVETGADVTVQRLLFAAGYNVPENDVVYLSRAALSIAADAKIREGGNARPLRAEDVDILLARAAREPDGRYRALASRFLPGTPVGGIEPRGTRPSDPNDAIAHQDRRDMRGLYSLAAWLNHTDIKAANTLDVWVPDRRDPSRGYVEHYLLDFGKALGAMARIDQRPESGYAYYGDEKFTFLKHLNAGIEPPWERVGPFPQLRGLGFIESAHFDPASWIPLHRWLPFQLADRFDRFWGAKLVMSFTPEQIRAALAAARYSEPRTIEYLVRVLGERQRKIGQEFFREVAPLDRFHIREGALCFDDLWVRNRLGGAPATYTAELSASDTERESRWHQRAHADGTGLVCLGGVPAGASVVEVRIARPGQNLPATRVHIGVARDGSPRVIALDRR
nr:hypothetical protein [Deltaproteobacteria bacterium]